MMRFFKKDKPEQPQEQIEKIKEIAVEETATAEQEATDAGLPAEAQPDKGWMQR